MKTTIVLASLLALVGYAYLENEAELVRSNSLPDFNIGVVEQAAKVLENETEDNLRLLRFYLDEDYKTDFRIIIPVIEQLMRRCDEVKKLEKHYLKKLPSIKEEENRCLIVQTFIDSSKTLMNECRAIINHHLLVNGESLYGLRQKEIDNYDKNVFSKLLFSNWSNSLYQYPCDQPTSQRILTEFILDLTTTVSSVASTLTNLTGGRRIMCNFGIPLDFYPIKTGNSPGDLVTLMVLCKDCVDSNGKTYVKLKINGKPFEFDYNGILFYQGTRSTNGKLSMEYWVRNPLTGIELKDQYYYDLNGKQLDPIL